MEKIDTKSLEKSIDASSRNTEKVNETLKQLDRTLNMLIRQLEKMTTAINTNNEIRRNA